MQPVTCEVRCIEPFSLVWAAVEALSTDLELEIIIQRAPRTVTGEVLRTEMRDEIVFVSPLSCYGEGLSLSRGFIR